MIQIAKGYDTSRDTSLCDWCKGPVYPEDAKILYGTGNSLLSLFHIWCDDARIHRHHSSGEGPLEQELLASEPQVRNND